jgi:hypothetical protein
MGLVYGCNALNLLAYASRRRVREAVWLANWGETQTFTPNKAFLCQFICYWAHWRVVPARLWLYAGGKLKRGSGAGVRTAASLAPAHVAEMDISVTFCTAQGLRAVVVCDKAACVSDAVAKLHRSTAAPGVPHAIERSVLYHRVCSFLIILSQFLLVFCCHDVLPLCCCPEICVHISSDRCRGRWCARLSFWATCSPTALRPLSYWPWQRAGAPPSAQHQALQVRPTRLRHQRQSHIKGLQHLALSWATVVH